MSYEEIIRDVNQNPVTLKSATVSATQRYKASKPWRGTLEERKSKLLVFHAELCDLYNKGTELQFGIISDNAPSGSSGESYYSPMGDAIMIVNKFSVLTYLHEFAHVLFGADQRRATRWSCSLFKEVFPKDWARLNPSEEGVMVK